ncbi:uncharacterized protein LOC119421255 [Nematolebias whitei]|uniref:uncharacterized protein LOC119421255 n=1 Tax=Nematolebias whitei TaxID=451745 RepID=UPI001897829F|nr:uncharacterized protein LOC119421255 [Nematolebias whitei]
MLDAVRRAKTIELLQALADTEPSPPLTSSLSVEGLDADCENEVSGATSFSPSPRSDEDVPGPSSAVPDSTGASACEEQVPEARFPASIVTFVESYKRFLEGGCPSAKRRENVGSAVNRVSCFLQRMASGCNQLGTWLFLDDVGRIQSCAHELMSQGRTVTTACTHLKNVYQFLEYFTETPPPSCRLSRAQQIGVLRALKNCIRQLRKDVVLHQITVKDAKVSRIISAQTLTKCRDLARSRIPQLLDMMEDDKSPELRHRFYGYFSALIASVYGHRIGVLIGMAVSEVEAAKARHQSESLGFVVNVREHKTNGAFGMAQIYLNHEEFSWAERWLNMRAALSLPEGRFLHTTSNSPGKILLKYLRVVWEEMGLPGLPSFTDIRTSVATHVKNFHSAEVRRRLANFMCHDTSTADRFYAMHLTAEQARTIRVLFEQSTSNAEAQAGEP